MTQLHDKSGSFSFGLKEFALYEVVNERLDTVTVPDEQSCHLVKSPPIGKLDHLPDSITRDCLDERLGESVLVAHYDSLEPLEVSILSAIRESCQTLMETCSESACWGARFPPPKGY